MQNCHAFHLPPNLLFEPTFSTWEFESNEFFPQDDQSICIRQVHICMLVYMLLELLFIDDVAFLVGNAPVGDVAGFAADAYATLD